MSDAIATAGETPSNHSGDFWHRVRQVALWSVGLGLLLEALSLAIAASFLLSPSAAQITADLVQKTSWSFLVCLGIVAGSAARGARTAAMGFAGLCSGPLAFGAARALHRGMLQALNSDNPAAGVLSPFELASAKALEYAVFGVLLALILRRPDAKLRAFLICGLAVGIVFGGVVLAWTVARAAKPVPIAELVGRGANEIVFPVGCALVLYVTRRAAAARS